jgi:hypothetical protein
MITRSIQDLNFFKINDELTNTTCYGCNQEWYASKWKRLSGCGPTAVTNIVHYLNCTHSGLEPAKTTLTRRDCRLLMDEVWEYVTPTLRGIPSTKMLYEDVVAYAQAKGMKIKLDVLDIPKSRKLRPAFVRLLSFLDDALRGNTPVAFLNLNNGEIEQLDSWHWVTIVSLEYTEDGSACSAEILDEGMIKKIDLAQWFRATTLGGGFVSFRRL